jgi:hypothetical protein
VKKIIGLVSALFLIPLFCFAQEVSTDILDNRVCVKDLDCGWISGISEEYGGCGCFNNEYLNSIKQNNDLYSGTVRECEAPPDIKKPCACIDGRCQVNVDRQFLVGKGILKEEAVRSVQNYIKERNIKVIDINAPSEIKEHEDFWSISYDIEQERVPLPPVRTFNVHKDTGETYEVPRE